MIFSSFITPPLLIGSWGSFSSRTGDSARVGGRELTDGVDSGSGLLLLVFDDLSEWIADLTSPAAHFPSVRFSTTGGGTSFVEELDEGVTLPSLRLRSWPVAARALPVENALTFRRLAVDGELLLFRLGEAARVELERGGDAIVSVVCWLCCC